MDNVTIAGKMNYFLRCVLWIVVSTVSTAYAQDQASEPRIPKVIYKSGVLTIHAHNATLGEILRTVSEVAGVTIDVPAEANKDRISVVELGPGPCRQILASLLGDSNFDYLIQSFDTEPEQLQSVVLMVREKKGAKPGTNDAASRTLASARAGAAAVPVKAEERAVADAADAAQPEVTDAQAAPASPPPPSAPREQTTPAKSSPLSVPALNSQSMAQQLQQMYQQRATIVQQERPVALPALH